MTVIRKPTNLDGHVGAAFDDAADAARIGGRTVYRDIVLDPASLPLSRLPAFVDNVVEVRIAKVNVVDHEDTDVAASTVHWFVGVNDEGGEVTINSIDGLTAGTQYRVRFAFVGGAEVG